MDAAADDPHFTSETEDFTFDMLVERLIRIFEQRQDVDTARILSLRLAEQFTPRVYSPIDDDKVNALLAECAYELETLDLHYGMVAALLELGRIYRKTDVSFTQAMLNARHLMDREFMNLVVFNQQALDNMIDLRRDAYLTYPALRYIRGTFLLKDDDGLYENPQHMWLRVALQSHGHNLTAVKKSYDLMSSIRYLPSSQTLLNAGRKGQTLSSSFALQVEEDHDQVFDTLSNAARITRAGGSVGIGLQAVPSKGRMVEGVVRNGLGPLMKVLASAIDAFEKGFNDRSGSITGCTEPWHADVYSFLDTVPKEDRYSGLRSALLLNDEFMRRVESNKKWTLFCPTDASYLAKSHGIDFVRKYEQLEKKNRGVRTIEAKALWDEIIKSQISNGGPSLLFKEAINRKSNECHVGTIRQTDVSSSMVQYTQPEDTAVCTTGTVVLSSFVSQSRAFDFSALEKTVRHMVVSLTRLTLNSSYPTASAHASAREHRIIGIGIQGLADAIALMQYPFDSEDAHTLSTEISETVYYAALDQSCDSGWLQADRWDHPHTSGRYDWNSLRDKAMKGTANALVTAYMSTADTSVIANCTDSFEPFAGLLCDGDLRHLPLTTAGRHLIQELIELGLWTEEVRQQIIADHGSIKSIGAIPRNIRDRYKTVWDVEPGVLVSMSASRAPYVCQSQSLSLYFSDPTPDSVSAVLLHAWKVGLKTGVHAVRTKIVHNGSPCDCFLNVEKDHSDCDGQSCVDGESDYSSDSLDWVEKGPLVEAAVGTAGDPICLNNDD